MTYPDETHEDDVTVAEMDAEVVRFRGSRALGRSAGLNALFDYLVTCAREGRVPREIEIAQDVFARASAATLEDGISRVYIHRLRGRLASHYAAAPAGSVRLDLPLGEYRLVARRVDTGERLAEVAATAPSVVPFRDWLRPAFWMLAGALLAIGVLALVEALRPDPQARLASARASSVWAPLLTNDHGTTIVEGDYYLFGETTDDGGVSRLIREFDVNSAADLERRMIADPDTADRYRDVGLTYLPPAVAYGQFGVLPILADTRDLRVLPASQLNERMMFSQNIVYVGLTSGLGRIGVPLFTASRFVLGETFDIIRDRTTGRRYVGENSMERDGPRRQFGLVSGFAGPQGNRMLVIAGTGDMALLGLARAMADPTSLKAMATAADMRDGFEALFEIDGSNGIVAQTRLVAVAPRHSAPIWTRDAAPAVMPR